MAISRRLAPSLLLLAAALPAVDTPAPSPRSDSGLAPVVEFGAGRSAVGAGRQVIVQGLIDLDMMQQDNYVDALAGGRDNRGYGQMRAELGLKVKLDERATAVVGFGYNAELGDYGTTNQRPGGATGGVDKPSSDQSQVVLKDAYVNLKEFLGFEELGVIAGRMPVSWNLVEDRGAFLFDSRSDDPAIGSWDGLRASYSGFDVLVISPWIYRLPEDSNILGLTIDWKPVTAGDKVFVTGSVVQQVRPVVGGTLPAKNLRTYSFGLDWRSGEIGTWFEGAAQRGDAGSGIGFRGYGGEAGLDWQFSEYGKGRFQVIGSYMTGDDPDTAGTYEGFVNDWESIGDTLIVEHEKYGEMSRLVVGDLRAVKLRWGIGFDERDRVRVDLTGAYYTLNEPVVSGGGTAFGSEIDAALRWQYTYNAQIRFFGGVLKPGDGMVDAMDRASAAAGSTQQASDDLIWLAGMNLNVAF